MELNSGHVEINLQSCWLTLLVKSESSTLPLHRSNIAVGEGMNTRKPVILSDQFDGFDDAVMSDKQCIMVFSQDIHTQGRWRFQNVNKALVEE